MNFIPCCFIQLDQVCELYVNEFLFELEAVVLWGYELDVLGIGGKICKLRESTDQLSGVEFGDTLGYLEKLCESNLIFKC